MWRRGSVVRVVDEFARAQRRERRQAELEQLVVGAGWALWGVRVALGEPRDAAQGDVQLGRRDPFDEATAIPWPPAAAERLSRWKPLALGVDEQGERGAVGLVERNLLVGGDPGAGKSAALSMLIAA